MRKLHFQRSMRAIQNHPEIACFIYPYRRKIIVNTAASPSANIIKIIFDEKHND